MKERIHSSLTNREASWLNRARQLAQMGTCKQRHGAVIVKGGRLMSVGINSIRNPPTDNIPAQHIAIHAEEAAIKALGGQAQGAKIYVARVRRDDSDGLSRPCNRCHKAIVAAGIKEVIYTQDPIG